MIQFIIWTAFHSGFVMPLWWPLNAINCQLW